MQSRHLTFVLTLTLLYACGSHDPSAPLRVEPATEENTLETGLDDAVVQRPSQLEDAHRAQAEQDAQSPAETQQRRGTGLESTVGGLWAVAADGEPVGVLVRRGSDDNLADRAIYDLVTLYEPESNLFFEITMTDAQPRYPTTTFFTSASCDTPVGISAGGCVDCRSGFAIGFLHAGTWWRVVGGQLFEQASAGSSQGGGLDDACTAHQTFNAKVFPVEKLVGTAPATSWQAPLHFEWR